MVVALTLNLPAWVADVDTEDVGDPWRCEGCLCEGCPCGDDPKSARWIGTVTQSCGCVFIRSLCGRCRKLRLGFETYCRAAGGAICGGCGARIAAPVSVWSPITENKGETIMRKPDRAGWHTSIGTVVVVAASRQIIVGTKPVTTEEATEYRDALTDALHWLGALDEDVRALDEDDDDGAIPEPCDTRQGLLHCLLDRGHAAPHKFYANASDDPWAPAVASLHPDQGWPGED